jgi:hypothetical protein
VNACAFCASAFPLAGGEPPPPPPPPGVPVPVPVLALAPAPAVSAIYASVSAAKAQSVVVGVRPEPLSGVSVGLVHPREIGGAVCVTVVGLLSHAGRFLEYKPHSLKGRPQRYDRHPMDAVARIHGERNHR